MLIYTIFILATGMWLFLLSQGLTESGSVSIVLEKVIVDPIAKSMHQFIEVAAPHMFAMGALMFIVAHFMLFSTKISQKTSLIVSMVLFLFLLFNIFSYQAISLGFVVSGWIKLLSLFLFAGMFLILLGMVAFSL